MIGSPTYNGVVAVGNAGITLSGGTLTFQMNGAALGTGGTTGYSELPASGANGAVSLGGTLSFISTPFSVTSASTLTIISGTSLSGTFSNAANNSIVTVGGNPYKIVYTATAVTLVPVYYADAAWTGVSNGTTETVNGQTVTIGTNGFATIAMRSSRRRRERIHKRPIRIPNP